MTFRELLERERIYFRHIRDAIESNGFSISRSRFYRYVNGEQLPDEKARRILIMALLLLRVSQSDIDLVSALRSERSGNPPQSAAITPSPPAPTLRQSAGRARRASARPRMGGKA